MLMKRLFAIVIVVGLVIGGCKSESTEEQVGSEQKQTPTETVEQSQPQERQEIMGDQQTELNPENYEWNNLVKEYNQLWCKYSDDNTSSEEKEKIYPRLKELQEELDKIYETVQEPQEKQALYQAMAKMVECK